MPRMHQRTSHHKKEMSPETLTRIAPKTPTRSRGFSPNVTRRSALTCLGAAAGSALFLSACGTGTQASQDASAGEKNMAAAGTDADAGAIKVSASFYPLYDFTSKVGKGHVEVSNLVPAGTEPHDWEPSTQDMASLQEADLIVYNGAGMESWVDDVKASFGETGPVFVEASSGIELRAFSEAGDDAADSHDHDDHADEHDHGGHDPHVWLAPELAKVEAQNIKDALVDKDPDHAADYEDNYASFAAALDELDQAFAKLKDLPHKTIVVSHAAFGYLCDAYGLTQIPIAGMDAEGEPDAKTMAEIIGSVKELNVKTIFSEELVSPKVAEQIAEATGASVEVLNPLEGLTQAQLDAGEDYLSIMRDNLAKLTAALQS